MSFTLFRCGPTLIEQLIVMLLSLEPWKGRYLKTWDNQHANIPLGFLTLSP